MMETGNGIKRKAALLVTDAVMMFICALIANWLVSGVTDLILGYLVSAGLFLIILLVVGFYKIRVINSSIEIVTKSLVSMIVSVGLTLIVAFYAATLFHDAVRWVFVFYSVSYMALMGSRFFYRFFNTATHSSNKPTALVYGAGELGTAMARLSQKDKFDYNVIGFIDDDTTMTNELVVNLPVFGTFEDLSSTLKKTGSDTLIIAITKLSAEKIQKATDIAVKAGCKVKIVPALFETKGRADVSVRDIDYADLLGRPLDVVAPEPLLEMFSGKKILVTGAGGSIGSEISKQLLNYNPFKLILLDIDETELHDLALRLLNYEHEWSELVTPVVCDIRNAKKVDAIISKFCPDIVFHAAAYKHVPLMELYPEEAMVTNICGSYNLFKACSEHNVSRVVVISTDKAVNPTNIMGATKRVVELLASSFNGKTDFCCVRFGNVIGSRGSMLPLFLEEIKAGKPITVTDKNIIRYFMAIPEAVSLVFKAATIANGGEVMVLDMGKPVRIYDFAKKLISIYGDGRSSIVVTGLRPGEKLYEELLADKDNTIPTESEKIFKAKVVHDERFTSDFTASLVNRIPTMEPADLVSLLHDLVPEFAKHN